MMTLRQLMATFPNDEAYREYLFFRRWPDGIVRCPRCGKSETVYNIALPWKWECSNPECRSGNAYRFSLYVGTIFENSAWRPPIFKGAGWVMRGLVRRRFMRMPKARELRNCDANVGSRG